MNKEMEQVRVVLDTLGDKLLEQVDMAPEPFIADCLRVVYHLTKATSATILEWDDDE